MTRTELIARHRYIADNDVNFEMREIAGATADMLESDEGSPLSEEAYDIAQSKIKALENELERERMRLAACGVVAMADTQDSAKKARDMHPDYMSASCDDVARRVDECIKLRAAARLALDALEDIRGDSFGFNPSEYPLQVKAITALKETL